MELSPLNALSPLDGRYQAKLDPLRPHFSEFALIRHRMLVEVEWLKALAAEPALAEIAAFSPVTLAELDAAIAAFGEAEAAQVKAIEVRTNHDVKALEYWLKEHFDSNPEIRAVGEFIHFACTSEDINNLSHALMLKAARDQVMLPMLHASRRSRRPPTTTSRQSNISSRSASATMPPSRKPGSSCTSPAPPRTSTIFPMP
jgi:adenylosuccinate lyase